MCDGRSGTFVAFQAASNRVRGIWYGSVPSRFEAALRTGLISLVISSRLRWTGMDTDLLMHLSNQTLEQSSKTPARVVLQCVLRY